jgi:CRP/FNR family transcriptional regulator, dissimilatory nitrate respiration regulator
MYEKYLALLKGTPLFLGISRDELLGMLQCLKPVIRTCDKNEVIALSGERISGVHILLSGTINILKENAAGEQVILAKLGKGNLFGETGVFSGENTWPATVIAAEDSAIMRFPAEKITGMCPNRCPNHRSLLHNMLKILSDKALMLNRRIGYLSIKSLRSRIALFLMDEYKKAGTPTFRIGFSRDELADYLGAARPSLSRELGRMRDEGILEYYKASIRIKDPLKLGEHIRG